MGVPVWPMVELEADGALASAFLAAADTSVQLAYHDPFASASTSRPEHGRQPPGRTKGSSQNNCTRLLSQPRRGRQTTKPQHPKP